MKQRVFIIHGWGGHPGEAWLAWLRNKLTEHGIEAIVPAMPNTNHPEIQPWIDHLKKVVGVPDHNTYFVGHSIGCQAILRYIETIPMNACVGGAIFVAGFVTLTGQSSEEEKIAQPWIQTPINFSNIKQKINKVIALFSDDDPDVPLTNIEVFRKKLNAEIIIEKNKGHFTEGDDVKELLVVLASLYKWLD